MKFLSKLTNETLICSELQVKDYKSLLKCLYGDNPNELIFVETICEIFSVVCNKPLDFFKNLSLVDFFCLLLDLRINSQGNICNIILTKDNKKVTLELKLDHVRDEIKAAYKHQTIKYNQIEIVVGCPSVKDLLQEHKETCAQFIKKVFLDAKEFDVVSIEQSISLIDKLPPKVYLEILKASEEIYKNLNNTNFLKRYRIKDQTLSFTPTLSYIIWFAKLIFNESLETFYDNIFHLSHLGHISASYIENAVVGEYYYFVTCLQKVLAANAPPSPTPNSNQDSMDFSES